MNILIVDDQRETCDFLSGVLSREGHQVQCLAEAESALQRLAKRDSRPELVVLDLDFGPGKMNGVEALEKMKALDRDLEVLILTGKGSIEAAVKAMRLGAADFVEKDLYIGDRVSAAVGRIAGHIQALAEKKALESERRALLKERDYFRERMRERYNIVGDSAALIKALELAKQAARLPRPVLLRGERGTGKELFAAAIHHESPRADRPFVVVNCAAIAEGLLECELFGQEENAFDGAPFKLGRFEIADHGTLFLDEVANMSLDFQAKILRVIEYQDFERVQGTERISVDVRIIAATNSELEQAMDEGRFRLDLYDRIAFQTIWLPPLRQRREDIPALCDHFVQRFAEEVPGIEPLEVSPEALDRLAHYDWPGNVRELKNVIEAALTRATGDLIRPEDLPLPEPKAVPGAVQSGFTGLGSQAFPGQVAQFEKSLLLEALNACRWNQKEAAHALGLKYDQLRHLYRKYDLGALKP